MILWERWFVRLQAALVLLCCLTAVAWGPRELLRSVLGAGLPGAGEVVPRQIPYRGYVERDGVPLSDPGVPIRFRLYGLDGGVLHEEAWPAVPVQDGHFSVELGDTTPIPSSVSQQNFLELEVAVGSPPVALAGRQRLLTVPFASNARQASFAVPGSELETRGVPTGTVVSFAGATPPVGWLVCDGRALRAVDYPLLAAAIGTQWGNGSVSTDGTPAPAGADFNLPDLRGRFLRGWDGNSARDPDRGSRTASAPGGTAGNQFGTVQADAFQGHAHNFERTNYQLGSPNSPAQNWVVQNPPYSSIASSDPINSGWGAPRLSSETRPKNVTVIFIIKQ